VLVIWDREIAQLPRDQRALAKRAAMACSQAHADYSKFKVGAALRIKSGGFVTAANVENGSYGLTSCAERNAIFRAVAEKGTDVRWTSIALVADAEKFDLAEPPTISPCGACRQVLDEFKADDNATVLFIKDGQFVLMTIEELLPIPFYFEPATATVLNDDTD
jgi:homotetrameric cytidine deaminase